MNQFPSVSDIVRELNRLAYARLIKDAKLIGIDISKIKIPDKINSHLLSARLRQIFKTILGDNITMQKDRSNYSWYVCMLPLERLINNSNNGFYEYLKGHSSIKNLLRIDNNNSSLVNLYSKTFKVLTKNSRGDKDYLLYNLDFINDLKVFHKHIELVRELIPKLHNEYEDKQHKNKESIQKLYDTIASKRKPVIAGEQNDTH